MLTDATPGVITPDCLMLFARTQMFTPSSATRCATVPLRCRDAQTESALRDDICRSVRHARAKIFDAALRDPRDARAMREMLEPLIH